MCNFPTGTNRPPTIAGANKRDTTDNDTFFLITGSAFAALTAGIVLVVVCVCLIAMHRKKKHSTPALQGVFIYQCMLFRKLQNNDNITGSSSNSDLRTENNDKTKRYYCNNYFIAILTLAKRI